MLLLWLPTIRQANRFGVSGPLLSVDLADGFDAYINDLETVFYLLK